MKLRQVAIFYLLYILTDWQDFEQGGKVRKCWGKRDSSHSAQLYSFKKSI